MPEVTYPYYEVREGSHQGHCCVDWSIIKVLNGEGRGYGSEISICEFICIEDNSELPTQICNQLNEGTLKP